MERGGNFSWRPITALELTMILANLIAYAGPMLAINWRLKPIQ